MKKLFILGTFLLVTLHLCAQNGYFLFIQSENNQPYYVQTEGKTLSSSAIGHLIISGLRDTVYTLNIGFPKNQHPEQIFQLRMNKKDAGYQLKNLGPEGWVLFNIQTLQLIKAQQVEQKKQTISYGDIKKTDVFSTLMAGLVNDSAVLYTSIARVDPPKVTPSTIISDSSPTIDDVARQPAPAKDTVTKIAATEKPPESSIPDSGQKTAVVTTTAPPVTGVTGTAGVQLSKSSAPEKKDSNLIQAEVKQAEILARDSIAASIERARVQAAIDSQKLAKTEAENAVQIRNDSMLKANASLNEPVIAIPGKQKGDSVTKIPEITLPPVKAPVSKPLIVWFSETKTVNGTELVYFDMTLPEKIDTIKILIPKEHVVVQESPQQEVKKDTVAEKGQKSGKGGFAGRVFGNKKNKNSGSPEAAKNTPAKQSTITVTTVETTKPLDTATVQKPIKKQEEEVVATEPPSSNETTKKSSKEGSGGFFGKLFGKKDESSPSPSRKDTIRSDESKTSSVKVTTVPEAKAPDSQVVKGQNTADPTSSEVEKLKKAQENEEKTSTERFFGKLFGKKKNEKTDSAVANKSNPQTASASSSIKVTTVEKDNPSDNRDKSKPVATNSDCREFASDSDVDKLRSRMLGEKDADGQIVEARKVFRTKCFTTKQVLSLSTLFRTDEGKYRLFDAAYPFVSDTGNFKELVAVLTEEYYINRFKAMVRY